MKMIKKAFTCAFPYTIPIFAGVWFLGLTYGISMLDKFKGMGWKEPTPQTAE